MTEPQTATPETTNEGGASILANSEVSVATQTEQAEPQQPAAEPSTEAEAAEPGDPDTEGAPEAYEPFSTPEGVDSLGEGVVTALMEKGKELNLSQAKVQSLIDAVAPQIAERQRTEHKAQVQAWAEQTASHEVLGGDRLNETMAVARKAYAAGAPRELQVLLKETGLDVHPAMVEMFHYFGSRMSDDKVVDGKDAVATQSLSGDVFADPKTHARKLYKTRT